MSRSKQVYEEDKEKLRKEITERLRKEVRSGHQKKNDGESSFQL